MDSLSFDETLDARGMRFAVVTARFNEAITSRLRDGARETLLRCGAAETGIILESVPGAWELPLVAKSFALSGHYDAVICLGAVIRGDTPHFEYVAGECARGLQRVQLETGIPIVFGVLTTDNLQQAEERVGGAHGHKGADAALTAIEMATLVRRIRPGS